jgi:acetolactate synthase-1/2/3 large subunit/sulfoacetaldehyde acetyltransferase
LLAASFDAPPPIAPHGRQSSAAAGGAAALLEQAAKLLSSATRPLIIAGGGVKNGRHHRVAISLAERLGAPLVMSPGHGDAIPCTHPLYAGQVGPRGNLVATDLARTADVILALGTRLGFNSTFYTYDYLNREARIVQVDIEPTALGRFFQVELGIVGDAGLVAQSLLDALREHRATAGAQAWSAAFREKRAALLAERDHAAGEAHPRIQPAQLYRALRAVAPDDAMYTMDAGTLCLQATDQLRYAQPPALFTPLDFGLVGFSYACGLGLKVAAPERTVISLMGDGGFGMTSSEIGTAVTNGINTICVVMNNGCWGAEKAYQRDFFSGRYLGADVPNPPYDQLARLWGAEGFRVEKSAELESTLAAAIACGKPAIVDVMVDPDALYSFRRDSFVHRANK